MELPASFRSDRRTVLIVEDEVVNRELLEFLFETRYNVLCAGDGVEALEILQAHPGLISVVLLDINMPRMNGIELLRIMREDEKMLQIPVIVLTSDKHSELETLRIGALDFIKKPYDMPEIILARVQRIIEFVEDKRIIRDVELDPLTGLYTAAFFNEYGLQMLRRFPESRHDMLVLDVDHFRLVNELYGKSFGNDVLRAIADGIRDTLSGIRGIGCRSGADVFSVLLESTADPEELYRRLTGRFRSMSTQNNSLRLRMGVYRGVDLAAHGMEWYIDAAKSACKTISDDFSVNYAVYDDTLHERELYHNRLISDMEQGLREKQFKVYFQPKYRITGAQARLSSAEALVRWIHPELGFISPGDFIPLFEKNGLIMKLDDYVWREAAAQIRAWRECCGVTLPVSVNLSRMDFFDARLRERLLEIVADNGLSVSDLMLEVTESAVSRDTEGMLQTLRSLREAGFLIEMDDFGSGYSSLNMLCLMPVDALKIDMKFVSNLLRAGSGYRMLELVVEMARALSVPTIVEGVEDEDQYRLIRRAGCDIVQGYYFSRPVDAAAFRALLEADAASAEAP